MENVLNNMRNLYLDMGPAEKRLADHILANTPSVIEYSITDLAECCDCGVATVVRFAKRLGYSGYQALKVRIAAEMGTVSTVSRQILPTDTCYEIFMKQISDITLALQKTATVLNQDDLESAARTIMSAKRIAIFGLGNSASIAADFSHKLLRVGLNAQSASDNHLQAIIAAHLDKDSLAIGISHSGSSKDIVEALDLARTNGAKTLCITNHGNPPITHFSDISLFTQADETKHSILALSSRIAQLAIIDAIYTYIVIRSDKAAVRAVYNTEYSLQQKKF